MMRYAHVVLAAWAVLWAPRPTWAQETGLPIHVDEDPLTCVVRGTGRILDEFDKYRSVLTT